MYGLELEHFGLNMELEREILRSNLVFDYRGIANSRWVLQYDGSVNGSSLELVSPILMPNNVESNAQVRNTVALIRHNGGKVDYSCGLHIHQDTAHLQPLDIYRIVKLYKHFQGAIDSILPGSRRMDRSHTEYCNELLDSDMNVMQNAAKYAISKDDFIDQCRYWDRYRVINVAALGKYGTLEFRQHSGTLNNAKIMHWQRLTHALMYYGMSIPDSVLEESDGQDINILTSLLRLPDTTKFFYAQRFMHLYGSIYGSDEEDAAQGSMLEEEDEEECECCGYTISYFGCTDDSCCSDTGCHRNEEGEDYDG